MFFMTSMLFKTISAFKILHFCIFDKSITYRPTDEPTKRHNLLKRCKDGKNCYLIDPKGDLLLAIFYQKKFLGVQKNRWRSYTWTKNLVAPMAGNAHQFDIRNSFSTGVGECQRELGGPQRKLEGLLTKLG